MSWKSLRKTSRKKPYRSLSIWPGRDDCYSARDLPGTRAVATAHCGGGAGSTLLETGEPVKAKRVRKKKSVRRRKLTDEPGVPPSALITPDISHDIMATAVAQIEFKHDKTLQNFADFQELMDKL